MMPRKICVVTGSRADYGLLRSLLVAIAADSDLQLQVVATGMHLSAEFGMTIQHIEADGFSIDARVDMLLSADSPVATAKSIGLGVIGFSDALTRLLPDILVLLGDRFEILAAAQAALVMRIPMAHIHGGETSEGAFDEGIRHALTKMSMWHFVAAEPYRQRVVQMGESPDRVFNVGAPGLDALDEMHWLDREALQAALQVPLAAPLFLITYHPVTLANDDPALPMAELLAALERFPESTMVFTYPNADTGGRKLIEMIDRFVAQAPARRHAFVSLGQQRYLSLMKLADVVLGNSSSGLTEAPALQRATVNIGDRQKGRLKATSVIDATEQRDAIERAIQQSQSNDFSEALKQTVSLYGQGRVGWQIKEQLKILPLAVQKSFFDIAHGN
jgi:UDP-N-acetylglucosamine 2-epimerase (non-hydrolysing)/GDP/UDP-N,N'-diacetylbacillosamine 2-epimerase (hydrolysing)